MKTRILSGICMAVLVALVLTLGFCVSGLFIAVFVGLLAAGAAWELLKSAFSVSSKTARIGAIIYAFLGVLSTDGTVRALFPEALRAPEALLLPLSVLYFLFAVAVILKEHASFSIAGVAAFAGLIPLYTFAFGCLTNIVEHENGIFYLLMLLNFSSVCDIGAYFAGSALGRHKLCPAVSPKKTVEGAVGGVLLSLIMTVVFTLCFSMQSLLLPAFLLTAPFCVVGMMGDLFASVIKRAAGIKDYSNLIPGHGGILDRVDSILLIAPIFFFVLSIGEIL